MCETIETSKRRISLVLEVDLINVSYCGIQDISVQSCFLCACANLFNLDLACCARSAIQQLIDQ